MKSPFLLYQKLSHKGKVCTLLFISAFLGLLVTIGHDSTNVQQKPWITVIMENKNAQIQFPMPPNHSVGTVAFGNTSSTFQEGIFTAELKEYRYIFSVIDINNADLASKADWLFDAQIGRLLDLSPDNQLVAQNSITKWKDTPAREFLIQNMGDASYRRGVFVLKDATLYMLMLVYPNGRFNEADYTRFIDSFSFGTEKK